ncbi:hypothetical protein H6761_01910 [Candidatus Nomurabacteria bacterium]|nr:hypothetical protein [Candidatus Nomurabacteria bacterium]
MNWRKIALLCLLLALPMWMLIRSMLPSQSVMEQLQEIADRTPIHFALLVDGQRIEYFGFAIDTSTAADTSFVENLYFYDQVVICNIPGENQYLEVLKDTLDTIDPLGTVKDHAPLVGGDYIIEAYDAWTDSLKFRARIRAEHIDGEPYIFDDQNLVNN